MPIMDGFEATRRIRKLERKGTLVGRLAIVALTANVSEECRTSCFDAGADHFLEVERVYREVYGLRDLAGLRQEREGRAKVEDWSLLSGLWVEDGLGVVKRVCFG
jgi:PleD family two-component response regulator